MVDERELPGMPAKVEPRRGTSAWMKREWRRFRQLSRMHDGLTTAPFAATALGVSRQRVHQLINADRIRTYTIFDRMFIACDDIEAFASLDRRADGTFRYAEITA